MSKKFAVLICVFAIAGCSEPKPIEIDIDETDNSTIEENSKVNEEQDSVAWYQDDLNEPVETVGMLDADAILASAGLEPDEIEESADAEGEPKKLYIINDETPVSAWFSHSPNAIVLNWYQFSDEPKSIEYSQQSLKDVYKLARAMAGREGSDAIMYLSNGGKYRSKPIGGHPATGQCNNGICFINIDLSND